jgi:ZIP family zinc transporter
MQMAALANVPLWAQAALWGLIAGSALLLGALAGYFLALPQRLIAAVMAFGSGVLIAALAFELMDEANRLGGFAATAAGFLAGAVAFTAANWLLALSGARHRKRSGERHPAAAEGAGAAIAIGALIDGIPESIVMGVSLIEGEQISLVIVAAVFLSNIPEGLSSAAGMRHAGRSGRYVFALWGGIALICGVASWLGFTAFSGFPPPVIAAVMAVAAGAVLAMLVDTMIPEAFAEAHDFAGLITVLGFLVSFALSRIDFG